MTRSALLRARLAWSVLWVIFFLLSATVAALAFTSLLPENGALKVVAITLCATAGVELFRSILILQAQQTAARQWLSMPSEDTKRGVGPTPALHPGYGEPRDALTASRHAYRTLDVRLREALAEVDVLKLELQKALKGNAEKTEWLDHQEKEIEWLRSELEKRAKIVRKVYKVLTIGMSGAGKTALTLKWLNPLADLGRLSGTKFERYQRTVSQVATQGVLTEHIFEVGDWGGDDILDAQAELMRGDVSGLLLVVDLAGPGSKALEPERIQRQLAEFNAQTLRRLFATKVLESCKAVVLFINKSDLISGTPSEVEQRARGMYSGLLTELEAYGKLIDIRVMVGSAAYGHSTHHLFGHFTSKILPPSAYDSQLLQRMMPDKVPNSTAAAELSIAPDGAPRRG